MPYLSKISKALLEQGSELNMLISGEIHGKDKIFQVLVDLDTVC